MNVFEQIHHINNIYIVIFKEVEKYKNSENELLEQLKERYPFIQQAHAEFIVKNRVFKKYTSKIKEIRSQVAAHFDINLNYWEYYNKLSTYNSDEILLMTIKFMEKISYHLTIYSILLEYINNETNKITSECSSKSYK